MSGLPITWLWTDLGSVADVQWGNTSLTKASYTDEGYPAFSATGPDGKVAHFEHDGPGIVLSAIGARCGKCFRADGKWTAIKNTMTIADTAVERNYLFPYLNDEDRWPNKGGAQPFITLRVARELQIPIAPLPEQRRIVAKIDSLIGKSRRASDHLDHVPRLVERYKAAILAAAFRGDLTREWRKRAAAKAISTGDLEILRANAWRESGQRGRYSQPDDIDWRPEIELPHTWAWASVDQLAFVIQYGSSSKTTDDDTGVAVLRMGNLQGGELDLSSLKFLPRDHTEFPDLLLDNGDVLFNRTNSAELVGKTAVYNGELAEASFASYLIRIKTSGLLPQLVSHYVNSAFGREWVASVVNQQVGQANVNGTKLRQLGVPVMPLVEQREILRCVQSAFTWIGRLASDAISARNLIDHLDVAVLAKAFRGQLVPQDLADEPASVLLDRIRAERGAAPTAKRGRRSKADQ